MLWFGFFLFCFPVETDLIFIPLVAVCVGPVLGTESTQSTESNTSTCTHTIFESSYFP